MTNLYYDARKHKIKMTNLLQFAINFRKPHRHPQYTLQLACEDRVLFVLS